MQPLTHSPPAEWENHRIRKEKEGKLMGWGIFIGKAKAVSTSKGNQLCILQFRNFAACSIFTAELVLCGFDSSISGRTCVVLIFFRRFSKSEMISKVSFICHTCGLQVCPFFWQNYALHLKNTSKQNLLFRSCFLHFLYIMQFEGLFGMLFL